MMLSRHRYVLAGGLIALALLYLWATRDEVQPHVPNVAHGAPSTNTTASTTSGTTTSADVEVSDWRDTDYFWSTVTTHYPVDDVRPLPTSLIKRLPKVQAVFPKLPGSTLEVRARRAAAVKKEFMRCWASYRKYAWMADELSPVSGGKHNPFGGWGATLVDSLDTLFIMNMTKEFDEAVAATAAIDFTKTDLNEVNIFETTIRYLGGFLSAYDLSGDTRLLRKASQVGEMIYKAFDTPNRMPITRWDFHAAARGEQQTAHSGVLLAELGSMCMELTRLSQVTGDPKYFDASQRVMDLLEKAQNTTLLSGQWPLIVNPMDEIFNSGGRFTLGAMADSTYEYLPKMAALLGGQLPAYRDMYQKAIDVAHERQFFRPMTPESKDILLSGTLEVREDDGEKDYTLESQGQHLVCFLGGLLALGGRLFSRQQDLDAAAKLTNGCVYAYKAFPHGIMPETFYMVPCEDKGNCQWDGDRWRKEILAQREDGDNRPADSIIASERLPQGFTRIADRRYILRPEAIESVFVMYRTTGKHEWAEKAWDMFESIRNVTQTKLANSAVEDVTTKGEAPVSDSMESFWMGETLKYFYLTFSDPDLVSLDEYVFNTEAHPLRRLIRPLK